MDGLDWIDGMDHRVRVKQIHCTGVPLHVFHSPDCLKKEINLKNTFRRGSIFGFEINVYGGNIWVVGGFGGAVQS